MVVTIGATLSKRDRSREGVAKRYKSSHSLPPLLLFFTPTFLDSNPQIPLLSCGAQPRKISVLSELFEDDRSVRSAPGAQSVVKHAHCAQMSLSTLLVQPNGVEGVSWVVVGAAARDGSCVLAFRHEALTSSWCVGLVASLEVKLTRAKKN